MGSTINDLRSTLSKEGCKTVALLARYLGPRFAPLAELWMPTLLKQVGAVSTQLMSSAANKCIVIIISSTEVGTARLFNMLLEPCTAKASGLKQQAYDFVTLCAALWTSDVVDR